MRTHYHIAPEPVTDWKQPMEALCGHIEKKPHEAFFWNGDIQEKAKFVRPEANCFKCKRAWLEWLGQQPKTKQYIYGICNSEEYEQLRSRSEME